MPYRTVQFADDNFYHVFNRGVEKRNIFTIERDYERFLQTLYYYQFSGPKPRFSMKGRFPKNDFQNNPKVVEIICYCLMPNHFHVLLKQVSEGGIQEFVRKVSNSYTKYFNTKHKRIGPLLQGNFKAVLIESDEQLLHVSRYIHLNPYVAELTKNLNDFMYSSYLNYIDLAKSDFCNVEYVLDFFKQSSYEQFVLDHGDYALRLAEIKHLLIDGEE